MVPQFPTIPTTHREGTRGTQDSCTNLTSQADKQTAETEIHSRVGTLDTL
jgi:hypothetical protein